MTVAIVADQALLVGTVAVLAATALRVAGHVSDQAGERVVSAAVLAAAAAVCEALLLGAFGLGGTGVALAAGVVLLAAAVHALVPPAAVSLRTQLRGRWTAAPTAARAAYGAVGACALLLLAWPLHVPVIGFDGVAYHLPEVSAWVTSGRPGRVDLVSYLFPFGNYPVTNEVALTWMAGLAHSIVPLLVWTQALALISALAALAGLAALDVPPALRRLVAAAVLTVPLFTGGLGTPSTDVAGLCWLLCAAALVAGAGSRPRLLPVAVIAAGLAIGTKTTTIVLVLVLLGIVLWRLRPAIAAQRGPLLGALAVAVAAGGVWAIRNLVTHGSPLWPFKALPGGDPVPHVWSLIKPSLLQRPRLTLSGRAGGYEDVVAGALLLLAAGPLLGLLRRRQTPVVAAAVAIVALLAWAAAPSTGQPDTPVFLVNVIATARYALPAIAAAAVALALAGREPGSARTVAAAVAVAAIGWNLAHSGDVLGLQVPSLGWLALAAALGAGAAAFAGGMRPHAAVPAVAAVAAVLALAAATDGSVAKHVQSVPNSPGAAAVSYLLTQPGFADSASPISFAGTVIGPLAGDRLQHRLVLLPPRTPCAAARERAERGVVVVADEPLFPRLGVETPAHCFAGETPAFARDGVRIYGRMTAR